MNTIIDKFAFETIRYSLHILILWVLLSFVLFCFVFVPRWSDLNLKKRKEETIRSAKCVWRCTPCLLWLINSCEDKFEKRENVLRDSVGNSIYRNSDFVCAPHFISIHSVSSGLEVMSDRWVANCFSFVCGSFILWYDAIMMLLLLWGVRRWTICVTTEDNGFFFA